MKGSRGQTQRWQAQKVDELGVEIASWSVARIMEAAGCSNHEARGLRAFAGGVRHRMVSETLAELHHVVPTKEGPLDILVIGDAHAKPDEDLGRFAMLGRLVADRKPDVVVSIGDWADMMSLSSYDKGRRSFEGRRYVRDISAANEALRLYHVNLGGYQCRHVWTVGNHEHRIDRATNDAAELEGLISIDDLDFAKRGWEVVPFLDVIQIGGVAFAHYMQAGNSGRAVSGMYAARRLVQVTHTSTVVGHSHLLQYHRESAIGRTLHGLVCGRYSTEREAYAKQGNDTWWAGVCLLKGCTDGDYDLETISMDAIQRQYATESERLPWVA